MTRTTLPDTAVVKAVPDDRDGTMARMLLLLDGSRYASYRGHRVSEFRPQHVTQAVGVPDGFGESLLVAWETFASVRALV